VGGFVKGDIVVVLFPFFDLSSAKKRPALVITSLEGDDVILCQITSRNIRDQYAVAISDSDFSAGTLHQDSNIRPNRFFTADIRVIQYKAGHLNVETTGQIIDRIIEILQD